ncbi:synaptosomal-associated protein 47 [Lepisosteus oculatus]|nr:PREDICTED: synaptosomal-associated protein 47 [Lepisosteus oculatus]XP_015209712.1 PREDICTED: synaptosomal-associated protein 47 [Lepisosteus oculatus]XP_015209714.1 PREDICTED: synaptosomal-associated protein 47 [Lepisosteus oculatus]
MNRDVPIHSWPGSYYINSEKRWVTGTLSLTRLSMRFTASKGEETVASIKLSRIVEIKKESSSFIFSALTILEEGNIKHWFSSLQPNRAVVYNVLEHFWREELLSSDGATGATASEPQMSKGKELIGLVSGSQKRLEDTGTVLHHQGEQFDNIMLGLDKIESDLDVADKLLSELESPPWWPFSKLPWRSHQEAKCKQRNKSQSPASASTTRGHGKQGVITNIPVIYSKGGDTNLKPGKFTVQVSALEVCDGDSRLMHRFEREDVDDIRVHSPYELSIRQRFIGKPDISYKLLSAKMPEALSVLEMQYKKKIEFMPDYAEFMTMPPSPTSDSENCIWNAATGFIDRIRMKELPPGELVQLQVQAQQSPVSESEAQELKQMLMKLKNLALEAEMELERQDEALDAITSSTDQATTHIEKHTRRMKKML